MTAMKATKKAMLSSLLALVLCFAMLLGTTFAWFTDSAVSSDNKIKAGTLDVQLYKWTGTDASEEITASSDPLFTEDTIWEPGRTEVVYLSIKNNGTLDLKYKVALETKETTDHDMREVMFYAITPDAKYGEVEGWLKKGETAMQLDTESTTTPAAMDVTLKADEEHFFALSVHMGEEAGNEYMNDSIVFDIKVLATQLASEMDGFGNPNYDADANYATTVSTAAELLTAIENGEDVFLAESIEINQEFIETLQARTPSTFALTRETEVIKADAVLDGNGITVYRTEDMASKPLISVEAGINFGLSNITLDGGAIYTGEINETLGRGTVNAGIVAGGALVSLQSNAHLFLEEGAILQNNSGANAVNLGTRAGAKLTINGGEIINNYSAAGAIWGGGAITMNSGKISYNHGGIGGAIRVVTNVGTVLTMNGGEMNHNYSDGNGGAIWAGTSRSNNVYVLNGGEMAYNYSATTGGAIYAGYYETVKIGGTFKMHDNSCAADLGDEIRFHDHASFVMTGGEVSNQNPNALFLYNNSASITGGKIDNDFGYSGGLGLTFGEAEIDGVINYNLSTNHNTAYLAETFSTLKFTVNEEDEHFANFNFKPAEGYTYTEGDEAKLICMNEGYETYWDAATGTFKLQAK